MSETAAEAPVERTVTSHLGWSVAAAVLFFLPLGLIAVGYALSSKKAAQGGDVERAERKAKVALRWVVAAIVIGVLVDLLLLAAFVLLGAFSA